MCLSIASGKPDWCGHRVTHGAVVYLAGEGHHGLKGRIAAWKKYNNADKLKMWLSKAGVDLNTPAGYIKARDSILALPEKPKLIIVDTLHRFLAGDENSAQDAKTMLDACAGLMREFSCAVCLVHHTGVSDEAQHRARGSSAWRGALEIEMSVVPGKDGEPLQIVQRKSKDAELAPPLSMQITPVELPSWIDEDGEPVTSAVVVQVEAGAVESAGKPSMSKAQNEARQKFEKAWFECGAEVVEGKPFILEAELKDWFFDQYDGAESGRKMAYSRFKKVLRECGYLSEICGKLCGYFVDNSDNYTSLLLLKKSA